MIGVHEKVNAQKYARLLAKAMPRVIQSESENDRAIEFVSRLISKGENIAAEEKVMLELMGRLISDFEERYYKPREAAPSEILEELMAARDLKQKDMLPVFGSKSRVSEAIRGKREISKAQAKALSAFFGVSADLFI